MPAPWERYGQQGGVYSLPPSRDDYRADTRISMDAEEARRREAERQRQAALDADAAARAKAALDASLAPKGLEVGPDGISVRPRPGGAIGGEPKKSVSPQQRAALDSIVGQVNRVQDLYSQDIAPEKLGNLWGAIDGVGPKAGRFNSAGQGVADQGLAVFRVPGVGAQSDMEARQFALANTPQAGDWDAQIEEKLSNIRRRVDSNRQALGMEPADWSGMAAATGRKRDDPAAALMSNLNGQPPVVPGGGGVAPMAPAGGEGYSTPNDVAYAKALQEAYNKGGSVQDMLGVAQQFGFDPKLQDVEGWQKAIDYRDGSGDYQGRSRGLSQVSTPTSGRKSLIQNTVGNFGATPLGGAAIGMSDAATFGLGDELIGGARALTGDGDYAQQRDYIDFGKRAAMSENPTAAAIGNVFGGVTGGAAIEGLAARATRGLGPESLVRRTLSNPYGGAAVDGGLFGTAYGAGTNNDDRLAGAATGGAIGLGGGAIGTAALRGAGNLATGVNNAAARRLADRGISLSPGQILNESGVGGRAINRMEQAAESIPGLGSVIRQRREGGFQDFNKAAFDEALKPINEGTKNIAETGIDNARDAISNAYSRALSGVEIPPDPKFINGIQGAIEKGVSSKQFADDFRSILNDEIQPTVSGQSTITGQNLQDLLRMTQAYARQYRDVAKGVGSNAPQPQARPVASAFQEMTEQIEGLAKRQAPEVMDGYNAAKDAFRNTEVLRSAVDRAKAGSGTGEGGVFTPYQLAQAASQNAKKFGNTQGTTNQPFFELSRDGQAVLPGTLPNSGTFDRQISAALMGAPVVGAGVAAQQGWIDPKTAAAIAALTSLYSKPGQKIAQKALLDRPEVLKRVGRGLRRRGGRFGLFGSSAAVPLLTGD